MAHILLTGMSGTGKSSALAALADRGYAVVETDVGAWEVEVGAGEFEVGAGEVGAGVVTERVWDEDRITALLDAHAHRTLFVSGTVSNQGLFYPRFDAVVLLSAPAAVILERVATRTTNDYGKSAEERALILEHLADVEPLLRAGATHEIITTAPLAQVVEDLVRIAERAVGQVDPP